MRCLVRVGKDQYLLRLQAWIDNTNTASVAGVVVARQQIDCPTIDQSRVARKKKVLGLLGKHYLSGCSQKRRLDMGRHEWKD